MNLRSDPRFIRNDDENRQIDRMRKRSMLSLFHQWNYILRLASGTFLALCFLFGLFLAPGTAESAVLLVPADYSTIQSALDAAAPGDTVEVSTGVYNERIAFPSSGTAGNPIVLSAGVGQTPVLDGTGLVVGGTTGLIEIIDQSYVRVVGFEIRNYTASSGNDFPAGIWIRGQSHHIEILGNVVHHIENNGCGNCGAHGMGIYGTSANGSIHDILIDGNTIRDCVLGWSESLVLNGNVEDFIVSNNSVHDNNNIGIDMIGFEGECQGCPDELDRARDGQVVGNLVYNIDSLGNPAYGNDRSADGIYVDGGTRIVIERNVVHHANIGIEIASEHRGKSTSEITVRNNFVYASHTTGFAMGGYDANRGSTENCIVAHNTFHGNDTDGTGSGEMLIQFDTVNNLIENNVFHATSQNVFLTNVFKKSSGDVIDHNLYFSSGGEASSEWIWLNDSFEGFSAWQAGTGHDANSQFADPLLVDPSNGDLHLAASSPAIDAGGSQPALSAGDQDIDGDDRLNGAAPDIGADEVALCGDGIIAGSEACDDGNLVDGDGCDSNCTITGCGNGIVTAGETCDDGNADSGDCCSNVCVFESMGTMCSDGEICTRSDQCDGAGVCSGSAAADAMCVAPTDGEAGSSIKWTAPDSSKGSLLWKWGKGPEASLSDFGDPMSENFSLCVLMESESVDSVVIDARIPTGTGWQQKKDTQLRFKSSRGDPDGVTRVGIKAGAAGKSKIRVTGKGPNLKIESTAIPESAVITAEFRNQSTGACYAATFRGPFKKNKGGKFRAKSD